MEIFIRLLEYRLMHFYFVGQNWADPYFFLSSGCRVKLAYYHFAATQVLPHLFLLRTSHRYWGQAPSCWCTYFSSTLDLTEGIP